MKKRNGFVFVETMVTVVILSTALLVIYSLFNNILIKEHRKAYFDDPTYVYRTNYLTLIFEEIIKDASTSTSNPGQYVNFSELLTTYENGVKKESKLKIFTCNNDIFDKNPEAKANCQQFFVNNQIYRIYISTYDLSYIDQCGINNGVGPQCNYYNSLNKQARLYFKQLPYVRGTNGYYIIFEFYDNGKDGVCSSDKCMHQFGSVKYGGLTNVVNYNNLPETQLRTYLLTNQIRNGSFENNLNGFHILGINQSSQSYNYVTSSTYRIGNKSCGRKPGAASSTNYLSHNVNLKNNHLYYYSMYVSTSSVADQLFKMDIFHKGSSLIEENINSSDGWKKFSNAYLSDTSEDTTISINYTEVSEDVFVDGIIFIDLTQAFGEGNEPSKEWCDTNIDYFDTVLFIKK